jgi:type VI secretion system protein ImpC
VKQDSEEARVREAVERQFDERQRRPFGVFVIGDLTQRSGEPMSLVRRRKFISVPADGVDGLMRRLRPAVVLSGLADSPLTIALESLADFEPPQLAARVPGLAALLQRRVLAGPANDENAECVHCETALTKLIDHLVHHPRFQKMEATWRGLATMRSALGRSTAVSVKVMDLSAADLERQFVEARTIEDSLLYRRLYDDEIGTFGGQPADVIVGLYQAQSLPRHIQVLRQLSAVAAAVGAPVLLGMSTAGFMRGVHWRAEEESGAPPGTQRRLDPGVLSVWRAARANDDMRYVCMLLPSVLLRAPYRSLSFGESGFRYDESVDHNKSALWAHPALAVAADICRAFVTFGVKGMLPAVAGGRILARGVLSERTCSVRLQYDMTPSEREELRNAGLNCLWRATDSERVACDDLRGFAMARRSVGASQARGAATSGANIPQMVMVGRMFRDTLALLRRVKGMCASRDELEEVIRQWFTLLNSEGTGCAFSLYSLQWQREAVPVLTVDVAFDVLPGERRSRDGMLMRFALGA